MHSHPLAALSDDDAISTLAAVYTARRAAVNEYAIMVAYLCSGRIGMRTRFTIVCTVLSVLMVVAGCAAPAPPPVATPQSTRPAASLITPCALSPVVAPTPPARIPDYLELDLVTNLHMTGSAQQIDVASYHLVVTGLVDRPLSLTYDDLRCLPKKQAINVVINCPGFFEDLATWAGTPLDGVLALAGVQKGSTKIQLVSADSYRATLMLQDIAPANDYLLAYEWEGQPLPIAHGFPVRAVLPNVTGGMWVKWLVAIEVQ
jgi:DMSO/TMAO reductase YedYZ molybdopterin-dependent catalytic subunit